jgi:DNA-binding GntR family transcriptional regulator
MVTIIDLKSFKEIYALRLTLAEIIGEFLSVRNLRPQMDVLERLVTQCQALRERDDPVELARLYNAFQAVMTQAIGNQPLRKISEPLYHQTARIWLQILPDLNWEEEIAHVSQELAQVIEAIQAGDMQAVAQVRQKYMALLLARTGRYLSF